MRRAIAAFCFFILTVTSAAASGERMADAMQAMREGDWDRAQTLARGIGPVADDIIEWHRLRAGRGTLAEARTFLARRGDWPGLPYLRQQSEDRPLGGAGRADVLAFYAELAPQTGMGALAYAEALKAAGDAAAAEAALVRAWRTFKMSSAEEGAFLAAHAGLLAPHHEARLDMLLWEGETASAERLAPRVSEGWQRLAAARIALRDDKPGVDTLIEQVPAALADHPGLAFERMAWRARKDRDAAAIELIEAYSNGADTLGRADIWANRRVNFVRSEMRAGRAKTAYRLAARHGLSDGADYAELEWLAGYIALQKLNDPATALTHFRRFRAAVFTPISLGRAGYWEGRAHEALGNTGDAMAAYSFGGEYQTSFYGLLAAERIGLPMDPNLTGKESFPPWDSQRFVNSSVFQAGVLLLDAGERSLGERFFVHLSETLSRAEMGSLADYALARGEPHVALMIAKEAARQGLTIERAYYPVTDMAEDEYPVPLELALSIARRESEFDPVVVSHAGARGLMQLMPGTAKLVARDLSLPYEIGRLTSDPDYNATLGTAYLAGLVEEFGDAYVLVAAGYNAGPGRPRQWIEVFGDPRRAEIDAIDWIESIPFTETRNYVMRVMESLPVYRARLSGRTSAIRLSRELRYAFSSPRPVARATR